MRELFKLKRLYLIALLPISFVLIIISRTSSFFAEKIFANHIYKWLSQLISLITGIIPISLAELIIIALPIVVILLLIQFIYKIIKNKEDRIYNFFKGLINLICAVSVLVFLFTTLAGINYYRYSFTYYAELEVGDSSLNELYALTDSLAKQANNLREKIPMTDEEGVFKLSMSVFELAKEADKAMEELGKEYPVLSGKYSAPKPIILSSLMSYTEITGIFIPFTMEANVNVHIPDYSIPYTMLHELAHLRGFMGEDEANYIAYLAGMTSPNPELQYSSTMLALITSANALYRQEPGLYFEIRQTYSNGVEKDIRANSQYWKKYDNTVVSTVSNKVNDSYLKINAQEDGVKSYGRMLDLLLAKFIQDQEKQ